MTSSSPLVVMVMMMVMEFGGGGGGGGGALHEGSSRSRAEKARTLLPGGDTARICTEWDARGPVGANPGGTLPPPPPPSEKKKKKK